MKSVEQNLNELSFLNRSVEDVFGFPLNNQVTGIFGEIAINVFTLNRYLWKLTDTFRKVSR